MTLEFTDAAIGDLQSIRDYTLDTWGERQEQKYLNAIWEKFEEIAADSTRWRYREDLFPGCQTASYEKHVILFRMENGVLEVVRILHSAMDFRRKFEQ